MIKDKIMVKWSNNYKGKEAICVENVSYDKYIILSKDEICIILDYVIINEELYIMVKSIIDKKVVLTKPKYLNIR